MKKIIAAFIGILLIANIAACSSDAVNKAAKLKILYANYDDNAKNFVDMYIKNNKESSGTGIALGQEKQIEDALAADAEKGAVPDVLMYCFAGYPYKKDIQHE